MGERKEEGNLEIGVMGDGGAAEIITPPRLSHDVGRYPGWIKVGVRLSRCCGAYAECADLDGVRLVRCGARM